MIDQYFLVLTTIDLFVLTFMCILTKLSETLNSKQKRGFFPTSPTPTSTTWSPRTR